MISKLRETPKTLYIAITVAIGMLFFMFYSFGVDSDAVIEGYKNNTSTINRDATVEVLQNQVDNIQQSMNPVALSADVSKIINMSETEIWQLISEGKYKSYSEANTDALSNWNTCEKFWTNLLVYVEVPVWQWKNGKKDKEEKTVEIRVNKYLSDYFKSYMTDLFNLPEKYVIESVAGFHFRKKNNDSGTSLSGHSFGATLDINAYVNGMGSVPAGPGAGIPSSYGIPWKTQQGLSEPLLSTCCTFNSSWFELAKKYNLDWGGNWKSGSLDPMHFSLVGDRNKDTRGFKPQVEGRNP